MAETREHDLINNIRSGVIHVEFIANNEIIASGSGFMSGNHLITNNHVFRGPAADQVKLTWHPDSKTQELEEIIISFASFNESLKFGWVSTRSVGNPT